MSNLVGDSGCNMGQLSNFVETICYDFRQHNDAELKKLVELQKQLKNMGGNVKVSWLKNLSKKDIKSIGKAVRKVNINKLKKLKKMGTIKYRGGCYLKYNKVAVFFCILFCIPVIIV